MKIHYIKPQYKLLSKYTDNIQITYDSTINKYKIHAEINNSKHKNVYIKYCNTEYECEKWFLEISDSCAPNWLERI